MKHFYKNSLPLNLTKFCFCSYFPVSRLRLKSLKSLERQLFAAISLQKMTQVANNISLSGVKCILHRNKKIREK